MHYLSYEKSSLLNQLGIVLEEPFGIWGSDVLFFLVLEPEQYWRSVSASTLITQTEARYNIQIGSSIPSPSLDEVLSLLATYSDFTISRENDIWMVFTRVNQKVSTGEGNLIEVAASALIALLSL